MAKSGKMHWINRVNADFKFLTRRTSLLWSAWISCGSESFEKDGEVKTCIFKF